LKRKIAGTWSAPFQIASSSNTIISGMNDFTISGGTVAYGSDTFTYNVDQIIADVTHAVYGVRNPSDSDATGYILTVCYTTKDSNGDMTQAVRLPLRNQITDIDEDFIFTSFTI
jgi:hypothetical protein